MIIGQFKTLFSAVIRYGVLSLGCAGVLFFFPGGESFAVKMLNALLGFFSYLDISFVVLGPSDGFVVQIYIALFLGGVLALPYGLFSLYRFVAPGLYSRERFFLAAVFASALLLFILGAAFGLVVLLPPTFSILLEFNTSLGVESLYSLRSFVSDLFLVLLFSGAAFTLPVVMVLLTALGIVSSASWKALWRYVTFGILVLSAIITPDGTGITMLLFAIPLGILYALGIGLSTFVEREK